MLINFGDHSKQNKEPDYLFVVDRNRYVVITSQLNNLDLHYEIFRSVQEPEKKAIILVYFDDD